MTHQLELEKKKYRNWVRGGLAYKYLKEGIEGFADDAVQQEHSRILRGAIQTPGLTCNQCCFRNLRPSHKCVKDPVSGKNKCPWDQSSCNCLYPKKRACPNKVCDVIMEEILNSHGSAPPSPNWKNTDIQKWCLSPWEVAKCYINAPGYSDKTRAADIDTAGLLHVFINNINLRSHLSDSMNGSDTLQKTLQRRNDLFHSPTMEMEDSKLDECIDDIIAILEDDKELKARHDAQQAVCKLKQLRQEDFVITTHNEVEVCRAALASIAKKSEELKQSIKDAKDDIDMKQAGATKVIDDKMQVAIRNALEALANHSDIQTLKQAVELLNKRVNELESDNSTFRQEMSLIKQCLTKIEISIDTLEAARDKTTKQLKYVEEKKGLQDGLVKLYQQHYVKTSISPLNPRENDVSINEVYVSPQMAVDEQKCTDWADRKDKTRTPERKYIHGYREIFQTNGHRNKSIYVVGDVGTGKSSFCKMMIQNWCTALTENSVDNAADENNPTELCTGDTDGDTDESDTSDRESSQVSTSAYDDNPKEPGTGVTDDDTDESDTNGSDCPPVSTSKSDDNPKEPGTSVIDDDTDESDTNGSDCPSVSTSKSDDNPKEPGTSVIDDDTDESDTSGSDCPSVSTSKSDDNPKEPGTSVIDDDTAESDTSDRKSSQVSTSAYDDNPKEPGTGVTDDDTDESGTSGSEWPFVSTSKCDDNPKEPGTSVIDDDTDESDTSDSEWSQVPTSESESDDDVQYSDGQSSDAFGKDINEMRNFDFLFFIPLQRMSSYTEITEMVIATTANLTSRDMIENIFQHDSERCLVLVDGLDEWAPRKLEYPLAHVSYGLPDRDKTKQATCVILSRPSAKGILNLKSSDYDQKVELSGITLKAVKSFIGKYLSKFDQTNVSSKAFMRKVRKAKLKHLQKTPLLLQQLLWLYCTDNEIGTSVSETYSHLLNIILRWAENKFEVDVMTDQIAVTTEGKYMQLPRLLQRFPACETNERFLFTLSRVAFETLTSERGSSTFGRSYLRKKGVSRDAVTTLIKSGILVEENCLDPTKENTQLEFIHISYLEYFAAIHVSCYSSENLQTMDTLKDLFLKCESAADILQLSNIVKMICGLSPSIIPELSKCISEIVSRDENIISYRNSMSDLWMYGERQEPKPIQRLIVNCLSENDSDDQPMVSLCDVTIDDDTKMSFLQRIIPENVLSLYSDGISDVDAWRWIAGSKQLQYMYIGNSDLSHSEVVLLLSMIQEAPLKHLSMHLVSCTESNCDGHNIDLSKNDQLQKLQLIGCHRVNISNINTERLEILKLDQFYTLDISLLLNASRLTVLKLYGFFPDHYTKQMNSVVHTLQQLRKLRLKYINIDDNALTVTPGMKNIEHIALRYVSMSLQTWCTFVDSLLTLHQSVQVDIRDFRVCEGMNGDGRNYVRHNKMFEVIEAKWSYDFSFKSKK